MIIDEFLLTDRVAIVTGAGRGIGAAIARGFAEAGADVVLAARTADDLAAVASDVEAAGRRAVAVTCDVMDDSTPARLVEAAGELGGVNVVVNNAGGWMPGPFLDTTPDALDQAFHFNVTTAFALTQEATPAMLASGGGAVVNISSLVGRVRDRGYAAYGTAKAALSHLTRLLAADLAPHVRVNAIAVGSTATSALEIVTTDPTLSELMASACLTRRLGRPLDIAIAALYLASPAGSWVSGKVLEVDGGLERTNLDLGIPDLPLA